MNFIKNLILIINGVLMAFFWALAVEIPNPLGTESWEVLLDRIASYLIALAIPVASLAIAYGAWQMMASEGNVEKIEEAKRTIRWAIIGLIIVILAKGLALAIKNMLIE